MPHLEPSTPTIDAKDLALLVALPAMAVLAWLMPEVAWPAVASGVARTRTTCLRQRTAAEVGRLAAVAGTGRPGAAGAPCWRRHLSHQYLAWLQLLRCHRPGGWSPVVELRGGEHLDAALAAGRGAILWVAPFVFSDLITKIACHRAGYQVSHLSRDTHGYSITRVGRRLLNPIKNRIEGRYLAERLVLSADNPIRPLRDLAQRLAANRLVSITVAASGQRICTLRFLDGAIPLATGAPSLALQAGAPLLPVFTVATAPCAYETRVGPPLPVPRGLAREAAIDAILARYVPLLESWVARYPDQFSSPYLAVEAGDRLPGKAAQPAG